MLRGRVTLLVPRGVFSTSRCRSAAVSGKGSLFLSILPLGVSGMTRSGTNTAALDSSPIERSPGECQ